MKKISQSRRFAKFLSGFFFAALRLGAMFIGLGAKNGMVQ